MSSSTASRDLHRLAELGRVSVSLLHEISNPLTSALLNIDQYADKNAPAIKEARRNIRRIYNYVEAARQQARSESRSMDFGLQSQVNQLKRLVMPMARQAGINLLMGDLPRCRLHGDPVKFQQILANLIVNAIEAYGENTAVNRQIKITSKIKRHTLEIKVNDWGKGIAEGDFLRIFEPFFTTKATSGKGLGIGLAIVKQYVTEDFKGSLSVKSSRRTGTVFTLRLPVKQKGVK